MKSPLPIQPLTEIIRGVCPSKSIDRIYAIYLKYGNVWKASDELGMTGQTIHAILKKNGLGKRMNYFTVEEKNTLIEEYEEYRIAGNLHLLANRLGRTKEFICRQAASLGLTKRNNRISMKCRSAEISKKRIEYYKTNKHPRGMLGKKHSKEFSEQMSKRVLIQWSNPTSKLNSDEVRQKHSDHMKNWQSNNIDKSNNYSRTEKGWMEFGGKRYFMRSKWEMNYAFYLEFLLRNGNILAWEYEPETFWFEEIKRGVRSYTPDFKVIFKNGSIEFHEVKGWLDDKSKTKLHRMKIYHPDVKMILIHEKEYKAIKKVSGMIDGWLK